MLRGVNDNPLLKPGQTLEAKVGIYTVKIEANDGKGVSLNGTRPTLATEENERIRYPHT